MRSPALRLSSIMVFVGWVLVLGGLYEVFDLLHRAWTFPSSSAHSFIHNLLHNASLHIGLGLALWSLARR